MQIVYRDDLGYIEVTLPDDEIIDFCDGKAYFTDGNKDYEIAITAIARIGGKEA